LALGELADDLLLASTRVMPVKLQESGFRFQDADLSLALG
jgi:NAD dependent epimerase/dehydratase family enzyme